MLRVTSSHQDFYFGMTSRLVHTYIYKEKKNTWCFVKDFDSIGHKMPQQTLLFHIACELVSAFLEQLWLARTLRSAVGKVLYTVTLRASVRFISIITV